jgi:RNA polymerase sigma-70 factor (ECF subfamily)
LGEVARERGGLAPEAAGRPAGEAMADDDASLVRAAIRGDERAFRSLIERYARMAAAVAYSVTGDVEASRDLVQEAFADCYRSLRRLRSAGKFAGWLAAIVRRKSISWVRWRARSRVQPAGGHEELVAAAGHAPEDDARKGEVRQRVLAAVRGLPPGYREVIVLRCIEDRGHKEICEILGLSAAAVDKRLTRAKAMLREVLGDLAGE